jgi:hypothetical protein
MHYIQSLSTLLKISTNVATSIYTHHADQPNYGVVWFNSESFANPYYFMFLRLKQKQEATIFCSHLYD